MEVLGRGQRRREGEWQVAGRNVATYYLWALHHLTHFCTLALYGISCHLLSRVLEVLKAMTWYTTQVPCYRVQYPQPKCSRSKYEYARSSWKGGGDLYIHTKENRMGEETFMIRKTTILILDLLTYIFLNSYYLAGSTSLSRIYTSKILIVARKQAGGY